MKPSFPQAILIGLSCLSLSLLPLCALSAEPTPFGKDLDVGAIDKNTPPGQDFFVFANGNWLKTAHIPADRSTYGIDAALSELTDQRTADLLRAATGPDGSEARKISTYFATYMDEDAIEKKGLTPVQPQLDRIKSISDAKSLAGYLGSTLRADVDALNSTNFYTDNLFGLWVAQDLGQPDQYAAFLLQGGLGLPDREYYLDAAKPMATIREKYRAHVVGVLKLARIDGAESKADAIIDLEKRIATVHASRVDSEDVRKANNHWKKDDFTRNAPGLDWASFFAAAGLDRQSSFVVWQPTAFTGIAALVSNQSLDIWKNYLTFHAIEHLSGYLNHALVSEDFDFYSRTLSGTPKLRDRWKRAVSASNRAMADAVGKLYVAKFFPPEDKARAQAMVANLIAAFGKRIEKLTWMAPATKEKAHAKLATLKVGVGYPDKWQDYSTLDIQSGDCYGNALRSELFELQRNLKKLGSPVDRSEWAMMPQLVNAVNLPVMNALNFPAAILQSPYFDANRPSVLDYGAIGATIGHEISHSFDDQGALFDATGRLQNWWTKEDFAHFEESGTRLIKQYDGYHPFPELAVNGKLTISENIADLAGLSVALDAYHMSEGASTAKPVDGYTPDQLFFLSFAQSWRDMSREAEARRRIVTDSHAPPHYRACTVRNLDAWYEAFPVKPGEALYLAPADRVRVW